MTNVTLSIPEEYYVLMKKHKEVKWTEIMRNAVIMKLRTLEDTKLKSEALKYAGDDWNEASELFKF